MRPRKRLLCRVLMVPRHEANIGKLVNSPTRRFKSRKWLLLGGKCGNGARIQRNLVLHKGEQLWGRSDQIPKPKRLAGQVVIL